MSDTVIKVEDLGKKYIIDHQSKNGHRTFRDAITDNIKGLLRSKNRTRQHPRDEKEEFWALKNINFDIKQGDKVGIIGRNGAGKSTLLKILSRITEPTNGRIGIKGRVASLLEVGTGFHPELTGRENVFLNGAILGMSRVEIKQKFDEIVDFAEVEKFLDTPVKRYSSGMYVRLAFAVAAHMEPEILIVDEVLAVGDAQFQKKCLGKMQDVNKSQGRTVLFVSHQMGTIAQLCDRAILLKRGTLICDDKTEYVIDQYISKESGNTNRYVADPNERKSLVYFSEVYTVDKDGIESEEFGFNEQVHIHAKINVEQFVANLKISITLQNVHGYYVSTAVYEINDKSHVRDGVITLKLSFPKSIIAPNSYFLRMAVFSDNLAYDVQENICCFRIIDTGTSLARYEGINYGSIILNTDCQFL